MKSNFGQLISTIIRKIRVEIEKVTDINMLWENGLMCKKGNNLTFKTTFISIQPNPSYDMLLISS